LAKKGFTFVELIVVLSLISLLAIASITATVRLQDKLICENVCVQAYQILNYARNLARSLNEDVLVQADENKLSVLRNKTVYKFFTVDNRVTFSFNDKFNRTGFKGSGHTKYARTLSIISKFYTKKISVAVGMGKIKIKQ
jgi:prepilin-type N-terminal cleavage/methylation domain-containing protein